MIKYFTVENFRSIKDKNILKFDLNIQENSDYVANPVIGFAGANASGKTAILQAITFVLWFMKNSFWGIEENRKIPLEPFCTIKETPTNFHIIFSQNTLIDDKYKLVDYEYKLSLTREKVLAEELYYYPYNEKIMVYIRNENEVKFGENINQIATNDLRNNCSIISFAAQYDSHKIAKLYKNYNFYSNIIFTIFGFRKNIEGIFDIEILYNLLKDEKIRKKTQEFLQIADVGIENIYIKKEINIPLFKHRIDNALVDFQYKLESAGTLKFLVILNKVLEALKNGSVLILDEIELKLHQNLIAYLAGLFENKDENKHNAQLIFSFHNTYLMEILKPAQLWFCEKSDEGHTNIFSATDFKDIKELHKKSLEKLYRIGRFGAKPKEI